MTWTCPRCKVENAEHGEVVREPRGVNAWGRPNPRKRLPGVECACGLRRRAWLMGATEYTYPVQDGFVDVKGGRTVVHRAIPDDPEEFTPVEASEVVAEYDVERFDITEAKKEMKPFDGEAMMRLVLERTVVRVEGNVRAKPPGNGSAPVPFELVVVGTHGTFDQRRSTMQAMAIGTVDHGHVVDRATREVFPNRVTYEVTFTSDTPARRDGEVLVIDGTHPSVFVEMRS